MNTQRTMNDSLSSLRKGLRQLGYAFLTTLPMLGSVQAATDEVVYFHTDALGSPVAAFNEAGEVCWTETYSPYGEKLDKEDSLAPVAGCGLLGTDVGYTGHVQDGSGLVYAQQRYYDPVIGRFMSTDPVMPDMGGPSDFGRYHYAWNNPYRFMDPDGRHSVEGSEKGHGPLDTADEEYPDHHGNSNCGSCGEGDDGSAEDSGNVQTGGFDPTKPLVPQGIGPRIKRNPTDPSFGLRSMVTPYGTIKYTFGLKPNNVWHTFRHLLKEFGLHPKRVMRTVKIDLKYNAHRFKAGDNWRTVSVEGTTIQYSAHLRPNGIINVGRMQGPRKPR